MNPGYLLLLGASLVWPSISIRHQQTAFQGTTHTANKPIHYVQQAGVNKLPPPYPLLSTGQNSLKRRQEYNYYNASSLCDAGNSPTASFDTLQCINDFDCLDWMELHGQLPIYTAPNPHSETLFDSYHIAECVKHKCVMEGLLPDNSSCSISNDICAYPNSCSSGICQPPLPGGCGPCTDDVTACIRGSLCSSSSNQCVEWLDVGETCVYEVRSTFQQGDSVFESWTTQVYPCGVNQVLFGEVVVPFLTCDYQQAVCVKGTSSLSQQGGDCSLDMTQESANNGCDAGLICVPTASVQYPLGQCVQPVAENGNCTDMYSDQQCASNLLCDTNELVCKRLGSVQKGDSCGFIAGNDELCEIGLLCIEGVCQQPTAMGSPCDAGQRCNSGNICDGSVCVAAFSVDEGGQCNDSGDFMGACQIGLDCIDGTCQPMVVNECDYPGVCVNSNMQYGTCQCDSNNPGNSTCQPLTGDDAQVMLSLSRCLAKSTASASMSSSFFLDSPKFLAFACCAICDEGGPILNSIWYSEYFDRLLYVLQNQQLNCATATVASSLLVPRTNNWCSATPDYSHEAMKSLVQCPNAPAYQGLPLRDRHYVDSSNSNQIACGLQYCNGHGQCDNVQQVCTCDTGFVGPSCNFSLADQVLEANALRDVFVETSGLNWVEVTNWGDQTSHCSFIGVSCNQYGFVSAFELPYNNLRGSIPASIQALKQLQRLDLSGNFLMGPIPEGLFHLPNLQELDLSRNFLTGELSPNISQLTNLVKLNLAVNQFSGNLPWTLGDLQHLDVLLLQRNNFTGQLPLSMGTMLNVTTIDLTNNHLDADVNLPSPICSHCDRFVNQCHRYGCSSCGDGQLLSCHNPNKILGRVGITDDGSSYAAGLDYKAHLFPEECGYHFG